MVMSQKALVDHIGIYVDTNKNYMSLVYLFIINVQVIIVHGTDQHHDRYCKCAGTLSID